MKTKVSKAVKAALSYVQIGYHVLPLQPNSKIPAINNGYKNAFLDEDLIVKWFDDDYYNIGIATGKVSNLLVIDVDCKNGIDGLVHWKKLVKQLGISDDTWTVKTPSGGFHFYYDTTNIDVSSITVGIKLLPGVDWRCNGGYVVALPSTIDGKEYEIFNKKRLIPCPKALIDYLIKAKKHSKNKVTKKVKNVAGKKQKSSASAITGERNNACYKYAWGLLGKELNDEQMKILILKFADQCVDKEENSDPLPEGEALACLASAKKKYDSSKCLSEEEVVELLNKEYFIIKHPTLIVCEIVDKVTNHCAIRYLSGQDLALCHKNITVKRKSGVVATADKVWLASPDRRQYDYIDFAPGEAPSNTYNLFRGFPYPPIEGKCSLFLWHIKHIICNNNRAHYRYFLNWMAHMIQKPNELPGVAIVIMGPQGTGKGTVANAVMELTGVHGLHLDSADRLVSKFNEHLADKMFIFADESLWGGNKQQIGALKAMITERILVVEPKGKPVISVKNCKRFIFASNTDWPVPMDADDRRFFTLVVSDSKVGDYKYFAAINDELENGGYSALMYLLRNRDISDFNPRDKPFSKHDFLIKLQSAISVDQWWYSYLCHQDYATWEDCVNTKALYANYLEWCDDLKVKHRFSDSQFGVKFKRLVGHVKNEKPGNGIRYYNLGTLEECQASFEQVFMASHKIWTDV